jgi:dTDP-4-dehydrorhamnose 3,5-epimerase
VIAPEGVRDVASVDAEGRPSGEIEGVVSARAVVHGDHRGSLMETVNFDSPFWEEPVVYAYTITVAPGRIKGWGMHRHQADRYATLSGRLRVVLYDGRADSPSSTRPPASYASRRASGMPTRTSATALAS